MRYLLITAILFSFSSLAHAEQKKCGEEPVTSKTVKVIASAGAWINATNKKGSLRYESSKMLADALNSSTSVKKECSENCKPSENSEIIFRSIPQKFTDKDKEYCEKQTQKTKDNPLKYPNRKFNKLKALQKWFGEFSQGEGDDGEQLYKDCDKSCSPQYELVINPNNDEKIHVDAFVVCGLARDKRDNTYQLSYVHRWNCG